jgi:6-phosphogluconolactonase (cycloisomerase 2 family)
LINPIRSRAALIAAPALLSLALGGLFAGPASAEESHADGDGRVFTLSNDPGGNRVLVFDRRPDGTLVPAGSVATGGAGTGTGLGSQGALVLSEGGRLLVTVNPGSNDVSLFAVRRDGLRLLDTESSGGTMPVSVTVHDDLVYVLNGGDNTISGLEIEDHALEPVAGSTRGLVHSSAVAPQIGFTPDGDQLIVTEKTTDTIDVFNVNEHGTTSAPRANASNGPTPFGFAFDKRGHLLVSNAAGGAPDASSLTIYSVRNNGQLVTLDGPVANTESAACWVAVAKNGRYVYTTNTGSGSISGYRIGHDANLTLLDADGVTATTGAGPIDLDFSGNGRFLYTLSGGSHSITIDRIRADGGLDSVGTVTGLPIAAVGIAAA